jgi:release factor glutamine methyltransferase
MTPCRPLRRGRLARAAGCVYAEDEADLPISAARSEAELTRPGGPAAAPAAETCWAGRSSAACRSLWIRLSSSRAADRVPAGQAIALIPGSRGRFVLRPGALPPAAAVPGARARRRHRPARALRPAQPATAGGQVYQGDLSTAVTGLRGRVDIPLANAPYVPTSEVGLLRAKPATMRRGGPTAARRPGGAGGWWLGAPTAGTRRASAVRDQRAPGPRPPRGDGCRLTAAVTRSRSDATVGRRQAR